MAGDERPPPVRVRVLRPLSDFLHTEAAGGVALLTATVIALMWANSAWQASYIDLWHHQLTIGVGTHDISLDLQEWINDGLMAIFFFVVGLEIKRELVVGELRQPRRAALPAIAAVGGMVVPALIYAAFNAGGEGSNGWAIPMATDIAMAIGVLSLLGAAVDPALKLFLLALAIVDDIGAIVVIAVFYSHGFDALAATIAVAIVAGVVACRALGVRAVAVYVVLGIALWVAVYESGIHATIAGVVLGLLAPTSPRRPEDPEGPSTIEWLEHLLHPWSSFVIVPLFALANAGVVISSHALADAWSSSITHGVVAGLVIGKLVGVSTFTWLAVRLGVGELPAATPWRSVIGIGALAGIGFTVSLFVTSLAFDDPVLQDEAKIAILLASTLAALLGSAILLQARSAARSRA
jgi:Na+:H+ antiporter, NhaA family